MTTTNPAPPAGPPYEPWQTITLDQLIAWLPIPRHDVYKWRQYGDERSIPAYRIGKRLYYKVAEVEAWWEKHRDDFGGDYRPKRSL